MDFNNELLNLVERLQLDGCPEEDILRVLKELRYGLQQKYLGCHMVCVCNDIVSCDSASEWFRDWSE